MLLRMTMCAFLLVGAFFASTAEASKYRLPYPQNHERVLKEAQALGAPMQAVHRALKEAERSEYRKKDVVSVFDISQPSRNKRYYLLDLKAGRTLSFHSSHGYGNGDHQRAWRFKGFQKDGVWMVPLGAIRTGDQAYYLDQYVVIKDRYTGKVYRDLVVVDLIGMKPYNNRFHRRDLWAIMHPQWYVTEGYRKHNNGGLGRSKGCLAMDPATSNFVFRRVAGGSLIYVTVGNDPIEKYLD